MHLLLQLIGGICGIVQLVCFILVIIQMFQRGKTAMGVVCLVLIPVCGVGGLVAFIYGWMNASQWGIKNIMLAWTGVFVVNLVCSGAFIATGGVVMPALPPAR